MTLKPDVRGFYDPATATWSYVVWSAESGDACCAIIDSVLDYDMASGRTDTASADKIVSFVKSKDLTVEWILETHIHADHLTAAAYLKKKLGGKTAISRHIVDVISAWQPVFQNQHDTPPDGSQFDYLFQDDEAFTIGKLQCRIVHTPGHTPSDTTYIIGDAAFVGDAMFLPDVGTGRCDFPGGSAADSYASTRKLLALPEECRMYVGHDYPPADARTPQCMATVAEQKSANIAANANVKRDDYVRWRKKSDEGKSVPALLLPSLQVNLRSGSFGEEIEGVQYVKIPVDKI